MEAQFQKYQALGNDLAIIDPSRFTFPLTSSVIQLICSRHFGLGADGICYGPLSSPDSTFRMRFFNPDGSESAKSGNGLRAFARYLWDNHYVTSQNFEISIGDDRVTAEIKDPTARTISTTMGRLSFSSQDIPMTGKIREVIEEPLAVANTELRVTAVSIGNPHCVIFADNDLQGSTQTLGPKLETAPCFPQRSNVQFVKALDRHTLQMEIWERGAGYTLASGSSASAAAGAAVRTGRCVSPVEVRMAGGSATVEINASWQVTLTGQVEGICRGNFSADMVDRFQER